MLPASRWHLSVDGRRGAERAADWLARYSPGVVATSPEPKARETAAPIAQRARLDPLVVPNLREHERDAEPYLDDRDQWTAKVARFFAEQDAFVLGSETASAALARFASAIDGLLEAHPRADVVAVTHGSVLSLFLERYAYGDAMSTLRRLGFPAVVVLARPSLTVLELIAAV